MAGWKPWVTRQAHGFFFLGAIGPQPYGFFISRQGEPELSKGDFIHGHFKEGEEFIERSLLG